MDKGGAIESVTDKEKRARGGSEMVLGSDLADKYKRQKRTLKRRCEFSFRLIVWRGPAY